MLTCLVTLGSLITKRGSGRQITPTLEPCTGMRMSRSWSEQEAFLLAGATPTYSQREYKPPKIKGSIIYTFHNDLLSFLKSQTECKNGYWLINIVCRWVFNLFTPKDFFSVYSGLFLVYVWPDARLSRWSYNKYGLIKLDRVAMLNYDYRRFYNMNTPGLSYSWSKIKSESLAFISIPFYSLHVTTSKVALKEHKPVYFPLSWIPYTSTYRPSDQRATITYPEIGKLYQNQCCQSPILLSCSKRVFPTQWFRTFWRPEELYQWETNSVNRNCLKYSQERKLNAGAWISSQDTQQGRRERSHHGHSQAAETTEEGH